MQKRFLLSLLMVLIFGIVFTSRADFTLQDQIVPTGTSSFGYSVAFNGGTAVVASSGTEAEDGTFVYVLDGFDWVLQDKIADFGGDVAIDDNYILIGVSEEDTADGAEAGAVHVFVRNGTTWTEQPILTASDGAAGDAFGSSVALDGNTAVIGAVFNDTGAGTNAGSAYVFVRNGNTWTEQDDLLPLDGAPDISFGSEVAVDDNTAVVSAPDAEAAYVFVRNGEVWTQQAKLISGDAEVDDSFGDQIAIEDDFAFLSAAFDDTTDGENAGSVYVFKREGLTWTQVQNLKADDAEAEDLFGYDLAVDRDVLLIGAAFEDGTGLEDRGAAYVFTRSGNMWSEYDKFIANDDEAYNIFGSSVAYDGSTALIGAPGRDEGVGGAYVFTDPSIEVTPSPTATSTTAATSTPEETATPNASETPDGTTTPTSTGTANATGTPDTGVELLLNGGFELNNADWTAKNATSDKRKCNKPGKIIARTGDCAYQFKGGVGERSKLEQRPAVTAITTGDSITLSGFYRATGAVNAKVKVTVKYTDTTLPKGKISVNLSAAADYTALAGDLTEVIASEVASVKVTLQNRSISGKVLFDDVSLKLTESGAGLMPLP
jgi:hypothetical protein